MHGLDAPLAAGELREVGGIGPVRAETGDGMHDFLADLGAVGVVAVAADPDDLPDVRELDVLRVGDPDRAADDPAVALVEFGVVGVAGAVFLDRVEDGPLEVFPVSFDEQEIVRFPAAVFFLSRDVLRGLVLRVDGVGGDDGAVEVDVLQQGPDLGGLGGVVRDPVLGDDCLVLVQQGGEQLDLPVQDAAEPFAVDRDRGQQPVQFSLVREVAEPAAEDVVEDRGVEEVEQGPDPGLARGDDLPPQRVHPAAQVPQDVLGQVSGLVPDLPEGLRAGQGARGRDGEDEHEVVAAAAGLARVRDEGQHCEQARDLPRPVLDHAGHGGNSGMRHCTGGLSVRSDLASTPVIKPAGGRSRESRAPPRPALRRSYPALILLSNRALACSATHSAT